MASNTQIDVFDMDNPAEKRMVLERIRKLRGLQQIDIKSRRFVRSLSANRFYWVAVVGSLTDHLSEEWGETVKPEQAHEHLKRMFLPPRELVNKQTGEVMELPATTTTLDTAEFSEYVDRCTKWLGEFCGVEVLAAEDYYEPPARTLAQDIGESIILQRSKKQRTA